MRRSAVPVCTLLVMASLAPVAGAAAPAGRQTRPAEVRLLRQAAEVTLAAGPRKYTIETLIHVAEDPPSPDRTYQVFTGEGVIDPATGATVATFGVADERFPDDATANTLKIRAPSNDVTYIGTEDSFELPPGKAFVEVPTSELGSSFTTTSSLSYFSAFAGKPRFRGTGEVGEAKTKTFVVDIPLRAILDAGGLPRTPAIEKELRRLERTGQGTAFGNLEIDGEGRIYAFATYITFGRKAGVELTIQGGYSEYGAPLDATAPSTDTVVPFDQAPPELLALLGRGDDPS